jgi:WD40 repeat protein
VHYWETFDASLIRELEVSVAGSLNALDISPDGRFFVTGGDDKLLKVLEYNEGGVTHIGVGHSDNITRAAIDPDQRFIVTATQSGSIFVWKSPLPLAAK